MARRDGRLGPDLRPAAADCATLQARATTPQSDPCGLLTIASALTRGTMAARGPGIDRLLILRNDVGGTIVDRTGLTGAFDWDLKWTSRPFLQGSFDRERFPNIDPDGPSIVTALEEQLGLKLISEQGRKDVLVIDRVARPEPD